MIFVTTGGRPIARGPLKNFDKATRNGRSMMVRLSEADACAGTERATEMKEGTEL